MDKKSIWKMVIQTLISILSAIGTTLGLVSCMGCRPVCTDAPPRALNHALEYHRWLAGRNGGMIFRGVLLSPRLCFPKKSGANCHIHFADSVTDI